MTTRRHAIGVMLAPIVAAGCSFDRLLNPSKILATVGDPLAPVTLIGAGDQHAVARFGARGTTARMIQAVLDADPAALAFNAGDLTYHGTMQEQRDYYHPTWGAFKDRTLFTMGNHDRLTNSTGADYYAYTEAERFYARSIGDWWRIYVLNSESTSYGGAGAAAQTAWLKQDIAEHPNVHRLAMWHIPMFSNVCGLHKRMMVWPGKVGAWWEELQQAGGEFVISGHVHRYERFAKALRNGTPSDAGMRQFVIGTGGLRNMPVQTRHGLYESSVVAEGVMRYDLYPDSYKWTFTDIAGDVLDTGEQTCRPLSAKV